MRINRLVVACLLAVAAVVPMRQAGAITGVVYNPANGHYYKLYSSSVTWSSAQSNATSVGGYLATVTSAAENSWIVANVGTAQTPWLGGNDAANEGTWVWDDGEAWSYTSWNSGEPNNSNNEDYLTIGPTGGWNDWTSTGTAYYIVEWNTDPNVPPNPTNLRTTFVSESRIDLAWDDLTTGETGYELEKAPGTGTGTGTFTLFASPAANVVTSTDSTVAAETGYSYRVRATSAAGPSGYSATLAVVTPPPTVGNLTATAISARSVQVDWTDRAATETGVEVERGDGSPGQGFKLITTQPANSTTWLDTSVAPERTYSYRARVIGAGGKSSYSAEAPVTTPLGSPTGLSLEAPTDTRVTLHWEDSSVGETGFEILRGNGGPASTFAPLVTVGPNLTVYDDDSVLPQRTYTYRVRAATPGGSSGWSADQFITTPTFAPSNASALSLTANHVRLTWEDNSAVERGYQIMRALAADGAFTPLAATASNVTQYDDATAEQETRYLYRVAALDANGRSGWAVSGAMDTPAILVIRRAAVVRPRAKGKAPTPAKIAVTGEFDVGGRGVLLAGGATIRVGESQVPIPGLQPHGKALWYSAPGVSLHLTPVGVSSRVLFDLQADGSLVTMPSPDGELTISYENAGFRAQGTVQLAADGFLPPRKGHFADPSFNLVSLSASLKTGPKDSLVLKGAFHAAAGVPDTAPGVRVRFGSFDLRVPGDQFTRSGDKWSYREGKSSINLDYAKGLVAIVLRGYEFDSQVPGAISVRLSVEFGDVWFDDTPVMTSTGKSVRY